MTKKQGIISLAGLAAVALCVASLPSLAAPKLKVRIIQTNSAGDNVDIIDPGTNKVVGEISGIEVNHGVAVAPDGSRIYISDEAQSTLDVADGKTLKVGKHIALSGHPNNIALTPDGRRLYVAITGMSGGLDVIDTAKLDRITTVPIKGGIHNPYVTPDGKYAVAGSILGKTVNVVDTQTNELAWSVDMGLGVRPMAISKNPDGSTKWIFVQLTDFNGFALSAWRTGTARGSPSPPSAMTAFSLSAKLSATRFPTKAEKSSALADIGGASSNRMSPTSRGR